ncbi:MAG TPA: DUF1572 family protein [Terriglobia bacterium]|nr:DUF1572 family protein [Terriglobia bacterium]
MALIYTTRFLEDSRAIFRQYKSLAEAAMAQVSDEEFFRPLDPESNSIALVVKHMAGNMRSRWTNFLMSDGKKPWRDRDSEFEDRRDLSRAQLLELLEAGWKLALSTLESLTDADLERTITIRGEKHSVLQAINRQIAHYAYHVGQIVFLSKHFRSTQWKTLSIARNKSGDFSRQVVRGELSQR